MVLGVSAQKSHTVVKGDTPYNIAKRYGLTVDELLKMNPEVKDGKLALGDVLTVKNDKTAAASSKTATSSKPVSNAKTGTIILQPKQTIYGITKQYRISETDLRKLNPELDSHMKIGDEVTLPFESIKNTAESSQILQLPLLRSLNLQRQKLKQQLLCLLKVIILSSRKTIITGFQNSSIFPEKNCLP
uniref:LysM peptidoglycan-binding domain-containing protein n=1 Tax=Chryseobacterium endophyticum TaxID=1854762 RepID=A0AAU6WR62_9FLAO